MCKIGILAIGLDLYQSAFEHFQNVVLILLQQHHQQRDDHNQPSIQRSDLMDLAAHFLALLTLVQAFRGRVNRQATGRIVFPVLAVKAAFEFDKVDGSFGSISGVKGILALIKSVLFVIITAKLAIGKDKSYVAHDEWFPKNGKHVTTC
mmetsp:Transcript_15476/g.23484  ORF Transcript_15476/g.23484 Transcript_15476/m.23484 type:complete len:149 (-) Transcript_15476:442-888(-)